MKDGFTTKLLSSLSLRMGLRLLCARFSCRIKHLFGELSLLLGWSNSGGESAYTCRCRIS
jgi:hypothetical protein